MHIEIAAVTMAPMKTPTTFRAVTRASLSLLVLAGAPAAFLACSAGDDAGEREAVGTSTSAATRSALAEKVLTLPALCLRARAVVGTTELSTGSAGTTATTPTTTTTTTTAVGGKALAAGALTREVTRLAPIVPAGSPWWVATCSLTKYVVRMGNDACSAVGTPHGAWTGTRAFPGVSTGVCTYTWSGAALPTAADYQSLDTSAFHTPWGASSINADCPGPDELPAECGIPSTEQAVPASDPHPHFAPDSGIIPQELGSCDVCATSGVDKLYVTLAATMNPGTIWAWDNQGHYVQFTPSSSQLFVVPVAAHTFAPGAPISLMFGH